MPTGTENNLITKLKISTVQNCVCALTFYLVSTFI
jgi:hypothetical protein